MITVRDHKTQVLSDPWNFPGGRCRQPPDDSRAGTFREYILPALPADKTVPFFNRNSDRPAKELYTVPGVPVLQRKPDLADEETVYQRPSVFNGRHSRRTRCRKIT